MGGDVVTGMDSATSAGLREFLAWAGGKGELNLTTANALKTAVARVLQMEDDPDRVDIRTVNVESIPGRFETSYRTSYTSGSMSTYKTRFRQATAMYLAWLDKDPRWKTIVRGRKPGEAKTRAIPPKKVVPTDAVAPIISSQMPAPGPSGLVDVANRLVKHHLPLRPDLLVQIELPVHLTRAHADRIAAFVRSLAFDDSPSASAPSDRHPDSQGDE